MRKKARKNEHVSLIFPTTMSIDSTTKKCNSKAPASLINRINYLHQLLKELPESLPLDPSDSTFQFGFDEEDLNGEDEGYWMALNRNLKICFQRHLAKNDNLTIKCHSSN